MGRITHRLPLFPKCGSHSGRRTPKSPFAPDTAGAESSCATTPILNPEGDGSHTSSEALTASQAEDDAEAGGGEAISKKKMTSSDTSKYWIACFIMDQYLETMAKEVMLPPKKDSVWRSAEGEKEPHPHEGERVMLVSHILRGLGLPPSAFFQSVCDYYGVQPHNLSPNNVLYIASFQALFEGYLGIAPRLDFYRYCFHVKKQPVGEGEDKWLTVCGSVSLNLCRRRDHWFPKVPKVDSVKKWTVTFFYCKDVPIPGKSFGIPPFRNMATEEKSS